MTIDIDEAERKALREEVATLRETVRGADRTAIEATRARDIAVRESEINAAEAQRLAEELERVKRELGRVKSEMICAQANEALLTGEVRKLKADGEKSEDDEDSESERGAPSLLSTISAIAPSALPQRKRELGLAILEAIARGPDDARHALAMFKCR
jgi:hypothetical protein